MSVSWKEWTTPPERRIKFDLTSDREKASVLTEEEAVAAETELEQTIRDDKFTKVKVPSNPDHFVVENFSHDKWAIRK